MSAADPALAASLGQGLDALGLPAAERARLVPPLLEYLRLLNEWNAVHNLTAIRDPAEQVTKHLLDSLAVLPWIPEHGRLIDIGTGAGLPGLPLALARPQLEVTLLDARSKKIAFCAEAARVLGLEPARVRAVHARCEAYQGPRFDVVISRAFSALDEFVALTAHLGDERTRWLAMKGAVPEAEMTQLGTHPKARRFQVEAVHPLAVPGLAAERCLVVLRRT